MVKKILVAELEVQTKDLQLEEVDVHEWDIFTRLITYKNFLNMFYHGEGDTNSFTLAPYPTLKNTTGYDEAELERQGWCHVGINHTDKMNFFQFGGRKRLSDMSSTVPPTQYGTVESPASRDSYQNAYFIGRAEGDGFDPLNQNFWSEEVIMNQMESDLALSREHWTESSKHKIEQELSFLSWGDCKINFSKDKNSLEEECRVQNVNSDGGGTAVEFLLVVVVVNAHTGIKNNHLNVHFLTQYKK
tara:strand:- start:167 stop:901 length:735 start_codon:yes stop_codon:yes gene_type:complete